MNVLVTAGPTREYIDDVRFITNASSGRMGLACAAAAAAAGHRVTLLAGPAVPDGPAGVETVRFISVADLKTALEEHFPAADALLMAAAVGDFTVEPRAPGKLGRANGPVCVTLVPTEDLLAGLAARRRAGQVLVAFAVEPGRDEAKARRELAAKGCDYVVLNPPAAMAAEQSEACILAPDRTVLPWARRLKADLAAEIVRLVEFGGHPT
jgi:phosphopantothenoylcysteine decarboxylase/phosphopantothenate--cysteine ligase